MSTVAFVTYKESPGIVDDDMVVTDLLQSKGVSVASAPWEDPTVEWSRFSGVVIRSPWNYHHLPVQYADWLRSCERAGVNLWNPARAVLANIHKKYLLDLAEQGVEIVPLEYLTMGNRRPLRQVLEARGWREAVVKPVVSAGAHQTWRTSLAEAGRDQARFEEQCGMSDTLVQPFMDEIVSEGEWSLVFFRGEYSHAVVKRPAPGDFRIQHQHGGRYQSGNPSPELIAQARDVLSKVDSPLLYARVDGVVSDGRFLLMELEINEPFLFLGFSPEAPSRFAHAILTLL
ncbi:ATP-grasp domain-containing protein [Planctomicrobium sp. SH664]|uniref:ATP-grasp domain-containing protein n=1 Tax=Planctomicrobium sp. SH664 TaxID=3448125 RepID=UPI003F5B85A1